LIKNLPIVSPETVPENTIGRSFEFLVIFKFFVFAKSLKADIENSLFESPCFCSVAIQLIRSKVINSACFHSALSTKIDMNMTLKLTKSSLTVNRFPCFSSCLYKPSQ